MLECRRRWTSSSSREQIHPLLGLLFSIQALNRLDDASLQSTHSTLVSETASRFQHLKTMSHQLSQHPWASQADVQKLAITSHLLQEGLWLLP